MKLATALFFLFLLSGISSAQEIELRVMTFNIWYGGEQVSFGQTAEVVRAAHPDLIGIQEPDGNLRRLAQETGYSFVDEKRNIISRYPLFDPDTAGKRNPYTWVLVGPGRVVAFANIHLPSTPFGPDLLRDGRSAEAVLTVEKQLRLPELQPYINALKELMERDVPIFFAGDFNSPSHLDWTKQASAARKQVRFPMVWPVTKALEDAGFRDSFREVYPDAAKNPGITFTPGYPHPWVKPEERLDRIDMIWTGSKSKTLESKIIGESGNRAVDVAVSPYPSDHRAVVSTFRVSPAVAPALISVDTPSFEEGSDFLVRFQTPNFSDWGVIVVPTKGDVNKDVVLSAKGPNLLSTRPTFRFSSLGMMPGAYDAVLIDPKANELARTTFYIRKKNAEAELSLEKSTYASGEAIRASWRNAPGMKNDWIGVYKADNPDVYGGYIAFIYTGATFEGSTVLDGKVLAKPLPPGKYELRLMREDSYVMLARAKFVVSDR